MYNTVLQRITATHLEVKFYTGRYSISRQKTKS